MPTYSSRRPDAVQIQVWIEKDLFEWMNETIGRKRKGALVSSLLAAERARREERALMNTEPRPASMAD